MIKLIVVSFIAIWLGIQWRIDHARVANLQVVIDQCVYKKGFVIQTATAVYGIVCGRAEAFQNKDITQPYEVFPTWRLDK